MQTGTTATAATSTDFADVLNDLSGQLKALVSTRSSIATAYGTATFNAVADANGVAVFTINDSSFFTAVIDDAIKEYRFNLNGATTIIINSNVEKVTLSANFLDDSAKTFGSKILWNFYAADTVTVKSQFGGSILATEAALTNYQNIEGGVYVNTLDQQGEIHLKPFTGTLPSTPVPEPTTMLLFGAGLMSLAAVSRKK